MIPGVYINVCDLFPLSAPVLCPTPPVPRAPHPGPFRYPLPLPLAHCQLFSIRVRDIHALSAVGVRSRSVCQITV